MALAKKLRPPCRRTLYKLISREGPAWPLSDIPVGQRRHIKELVEAGFAMTFAANGVDHLVLTQDAADLFGRVPDETGGLKDPVVSRMPCLGDSIEEGTLGYLDSLVAGGRVGGIFRQARRFSREG